jgi:hypothetical protein
MTMVKKTIITFVTLFIIYAIFVAFFAPKWWHASQHQWQDNIIKAQNFLYDESDTIQNLIIGSSLSNRIITDSLPKTYNLSFGGQSIFDGLNILTHKSKMPANIFIEINVVLREESKNFTQSLNSPLLYYPRKTISSLREDKQPMAVLGLGIRIICYKIKNKVKSILVPTEKRGDIKKNIKIETKPNVNNSLVETKSNVNNSLFTKMLNDQIESYSKIPKQEALNNSFSLLKEYLKKIELINKEVNIIFFEMPVNYQLENLPGAKIVRETFFKEFPQTKYSYTLLPDSLKCETTDGVHLRSDEAIKYTIYFKSKNKNYFR